jgi:hypothetical protein
VNPDPLLGRGQDGLRGVDPDDLLDLAPRVLRIGRRQVDLVDDGDDRQVEIHGQVDIRQRLGLDPLGRVDDQHGALTGGQGARHLVVEVDVPGRVDEVQLVLLAVLGRVIEPHRRSLDRDAALALQVHAVHELRAALAIGQRVGRVQQAIRQRRLAVVDVGDDREIADQVRRGGHLRRGGAAGALALTWKVGPGG